MGINTHTCTVFIATQLIGAYNYPERDSQAFSLFNHDILKI